MARIVVTGATGFIDRQAIPELVAQGHEVHCLLRTNAPVAHTTCHQINLLTDGDAVTDLLASIKPQKLLHFAWSVTPGAFWTDRQNLDWVGATLKLYRAFTKAGGERMVVAGTCAEYDWSGVNTNDPLTELTSPQKPATLYGQAKKSMFDCLNVAANLDGVSLASGRIFQLYGPGEKRGRVTSDAIFSLLCETPFETTKGTQLRDFMHVTDVARAFVALLESDVTGPVNIASGVDLPVAEVLQEIGRQTGRIDLLQFGARPMAAHETKRIAADTCRLQDEVGYTTRFDLVTGIADAIDWWRHQIMSDQLNNV